LGDDLINDDDKDKGNDAAATNSNGNANDTTTTTTTTTSNDQDATDVLRELSRYHPIVIEGMGYYDPRDPSVVAENICKNLKSHLGWSSSSGNSSNNNKSSSNNNKSSNNNNNRKPYLVVVQGDPLSERGISAITPLVAKFLGLERGLVCLDPHIDPTHSQNADRENVVLEVGYSQLADALALALALHDDDDDDDDKSGTVLLQTVEESIDALILEKNRERQSLGKPPMKEYFKQYALLQEVTKASLRKLCGDQLTIAHTSAEINPYSVTSFYRVGLDLGLYHEETDVVAYRNHCDRHQDEEILDFEAIDKR